MNSNDHQYVDGLPQERIDEIISIVHERCIVEVLPPNAEFDHRVVEDEDEDPVLEIWPCSIQMFGGEDDGQVSPADYALDVNAVVEHVFDGECSMRWESTGDIMFFHEDGEFTLRFLVGDPEEDDDTKPRFRFNLFAGELQSNELDEPE